MPISVSIFENHPMTNDVKFYYSRSAVTTDWTCPRKRFLEYHYGGRGLSPATTNLELFLGITLHDGLAAIAQGLAIDDIAEATKQQMLEGLNPTIGGEVDSDEFIAEQTALVEGLLRGFNRMVWPRIQAMYPEIVAIEQEFVYEHDGLTFISKPDLILRDHMGNLWYLEYKSTKSVKEEWINSWSTAVQLHSSIRAVSETLGEEVTGVIVQGLYKGYVSYGKQNSPFCYAYHRPGTPPFTKDEWRYDYMAGFKRFPVWKKDGGVKAWVSGMPEEKLAEQFPQVPPIFMREDLINDFFKQRAIREREIATALNLLVISPEDTDDIMNMYFPQKFEACTPAWGKPCSFRKICHGRIDDPLVSGYTTRVPHHQIEVDALSAIEE